VNSVLRVVAAALGLIFLACLVLAAPSYRQQHRILKTWPGVEAEVVRSQVTPHPEGGTPLYATDLQLAYSVDGRPYLGAYRFPHLSTNYQRKQKQAAQYPPGSRHRIRYSPADPTDIRIHVGYNLEFFMVPVFITGLGLIFAAPAVVLLLVARARRPRPVAAARSAAGGAGEKAVQ